MLLSSYVVILILLVGLVGLWGKFQFDAELTKSYPTMWSNLGNQSTFSGNTMLREFKWIAFVVLRSYSKLGDRRLSIFGNLVLACGVVNLVILIACAFIFRGPAPTLG